MVNQKHLFRAHEVLDVFAPALPASRQDRFVAENCDYLAEQFAEVEREALGSVAKSWQDGPENQSLCYCAAGAGVPHFHLRSPRL